MRSVVADLWDEWSSYPAKDEEASSQETAGLLGPWAPDPVMGVVKARDRAARWAGKGLDPDRREGDSLAPATPITGPGPTALVGSSRLWVVRRLLKLWKTSRWARELNLAACVRVPPSMKGRVGIELPLSLYEEITAVTGRETWDWVRGVWGSCGALYTPRAGYYLVMRTSEESTARRLVQILRRARVSHSLRARRGTRELILRNQQSIVTFLSKIGLTGVSLSMEDKAILRAVRNQANRESNCDTANIKKSLKTAEEQMELALALQRDGLVASLPERFRELVELRLEHPDATLSELGQLLSPPVTKSTVKYRWNRLPGA